MYVPRDFGSYLFLLCMDVMGDLSLNNLCYYLLHSTGSLPHSPQMVQALRADKTDLELKPESTPAVYENRCVWELARMRIGVYRRNWCVWDLVCMEIGVWEIVAMTIGLYGSWCMKIGVHENS